jgi:drug/metabolite transporter (DMT)-like permease
MSTLATVLLVLVMLSNTAGQLLFKAASLRAQGHGVTSHWQGLAISPLLWLGILFYVPEFLFWLAFLSLVPLWQAVMVASVDIVLVLIGGRLLFKERLVPSRISAIALIAIGVFLVGWSG